MSKDNRKEPEKRGLLNLVEDITVRLAAENGDASAQYTLGVMYISGNGVPQDAREAMKWFRLAAEQGQTGAQFNLGVGYAHGQGVRKNYIQAHKWINLAASRTAPGEAGDYQSGRDGLAKKMAASQVAEAQRLAMEWQPKTWEQLKDE